MKCAPGRARPPTIPIRRLWMSWRPASAWPVLAGYNEFCAPTVAEAIGRAVAEGATQIIVVPTMLPRGNQHTEAEISAIVAESRKRHPLAIIRYAWPFDDDRVVSLFVEHILANGEKC